eukprot:TRINITY_DN13008_c0_g1_i6.p1 TRINITY_DN13008_c0_g1~~TRINITY_DN13008_c0_g1_i6.p1  ORF type:complete len:146 (-),score=13.04 TRINITY_DN13008_c0_g1_i6:66-503(-)
MYNYLVEIPGSSRCGLGGLSRLLFLLLPLPKEGVPRFRAILGCAFQIHLLVQRSISRTRHVRQAPGGPAAAIISIVAIHPQLHLIFLNIALFGILGQHHLQQLPPLFRGLIILSLIHISEPTRLLSISYAVFCLKKKKKKKRKKY